MNRTCHLFGLATQPRWKKRTGETQITGKALSVEDGITGVDGPPARRKTGRPRCQVSADEVRRLRDQGASWRQIATNLGIGSATAMRAYNAASRVGKASQNSGGLSEDPEFPAEPVVPGRASALNGSVHRSMPERMIDSGFANLCTSQFEGRVAYVQRWTRAIPGK